MCIHRTPDCTGRWERRVAPVLYVRVWQCDRCGVSYPVTDGHTAAASLENRIGLQMHLLATEAASRTAPVNRLAQRGVL